MMIHIRAEGTRVRVGLAVGAIFLVLSAISILPARASEENKGDAVASDGQEEGRLQQPKEGLIRNIWWNQEENVEKLSLTEKQREKMDAIFGDFLDEQPDSQANVKDSRLAFQDALKSGKWDEARKLERQLATAMADVSTAQFRLKIDVLELLSQEQFEVFRTDYSELFQRLWIRRFALGGTARQAGTSGRQGAGGGTR